MVSQSLSSMSGRSSLNFASSCGPFRALMMCVGPSCITVISDVSRCSNL